MGKRYLCERCGTGSIAPARMAPDDVRRFCLDCSRKTGKLVPLICPSRERAKERTRNRAAQKARAAREKEIEKKYTLRDGGDSRRIFKAVQGLHTWKNEGDVAYHEICRMKHIVAGLHRYQDSTEYAFQVICAMAGAAAFRIAETTGGRFTRDGRQARAKQSLIRTASVEYFSLDDSELIQIRAATNRLTGREDETWVRTVQQALAART